MEKRRLAVYSLGHFLVDFSCALLVLGRLAPAAGDRAVVFLLYNFCAFALQMPLGLLWDRLDRNYAAAAGGCLLVLCAWLLPAPGGLLCCGVGNALFHVGGGLDTLNRSGERCGELGIFVSPGALGLFFGGALAGESWAHLCAAAGLALWAVLLPCLCRARGNPPAALPEEHRARAWGGLLCLFFVVILRSLAGMSFSFPWREEAGLLLALATALGKGAGGLLADRWGREKLAALSLAASALLFPLSHVPAAGLAAVFLFNMTMPLTLWGAARLFDRAKGFAFGVLTFGLFLGYLPPALGLSGGGWAFSSALAVLSLPILLLGLRRAEA